MRTTWQSQIDGSLSDMLKLAYRQGAVDALANVEQSVVSSMNSTGQDVAVSYIATDEDGDGLGDGITDGTGDGITDGTGDGITDGTGDGIGDNTGALTYTAADIQNVCAGIRIGVEAKSEEYIASQGDFVQIQLTDESVGASTFELSNATDEEGNPVVPPTIEENNNVESGASTEEFISDGIVDVMVSGISTAISCGAGTIATSIIMGTTLGTAVPGIGNVIGVVVGLGVGLWLNNVIDEDKDGDGNTLRDDIKDTVFSWVSGGM